MVNRDEIRREAIRYVLRRYFQGSSRELLDSLAQGTSNRGGQDLELRQSADSGNSEAS